MFPVIRGEKRQNSDRSDAIDERACRSLLRVFWRPLLESWKLRGEYNYEFPLKQMKIVPVAYPGPQNVPPLSHGTPLFFFFRVGEMNT